MLIPGKDSAIRDTTADGLPQPAPAPTETGQQTLPVVIPPAGTPPVGAAKARSRWWVWAMGGLLAAGLAGAMYLQPWANKAAAVTVETMVLGPVTRVLAVNGRIAGLHSVEVRPLVSGTLTEVMVAEGDIVTQTQILMRLDMAAQRAIERQAMAGLDAAIVAQQDAVATLARTKALGSNAARIALESATRAALTAAQEVARMTAILEEVQIQMAKFTIRAPMAGTVLVLHADPGQSVDPATTLMTIADLGQLVVETDVDESYATQIRKGQPAALQLSGEGEVREGRVSFVSQRVDADTGGLAVKLAPDQPLSAPIGLMVTANITVDDRAAAITVPRAALVTDAAGDAVLILSDGHAQRRDVQVIDWPAARLIVTDGLSEGDVVITDATGLTDGQSVQVDP